MTQANQWTQDDDRERSSIERRSSSNDRSARRSGRQGVPPYLPSPFSLMSEFMFDVDRVLRDFVGSGTGLVTQPGPARIASSEPSAFTPAVELFERDGELVVRADLPGLERKDIRVEIDEERIVVSGERAQKSEEQKAGYYRSEVTYGRFSRVIALPDGSHGEQARATFSDGVLEIDVPIERDQHAKRRRIEIEPGESKESERQRSQTRES